MKQIQRAFVPGSEWLYVKIYTGNKTADAILIKAISSIIVSLKKDQLIEKWFFIRYSDPDFHLRVRILVKDKQYVGKVMNLFHDRLSYLVKHNLVWKIQMDTYNRELERYGKNLIEEAETVFYADSECVLILLKKLSACQNENYRWMIALKMIDCFLSDFSFDLQLKQLLMDSLSNSFKAEFGFNQYNSKQLNHKYRENKHLIEQVLNNKVLDTNFIKLYKPIEKRSKALKEVINQLHLKMKKQKENIGMNDLLSSYIHMMLNRLFLSKNRIHELVLYDFLKRYYTSEIAKRKYITKV